MAKSESAAPGATHLRKLRQRLRTGEPLVFAGLGDSLTYGWMVSEGFFDRCIRRLRDRFQRAAIESINAGIPGDTAAGGLSRLPDLLRSRPNVVTIQFGLNDMYQDVSPEAFELTIEAIVGSVLDVSAVPILVTSCPLNWPEGQKTATSFYNRVRRAAALVDVPCASLDEYWLTIAGPPSAWRGLVQSDDVHPTDEGHALMATGLFQYLADSEV